MKVIVDHLVLSPLCPVEGPEAPRRTEIYAASPVKRRLETALDTVESSLDLLSVGTQSDLQRFLSAQ